METNKSDQDWDVLLPPKPPDLHNGEEHFDDSVNFDGALPRYVRLNNEWKAKDAVQQI
jgi:hypothetical protein